MKGRAYEPRGPVAVEQRPRVVALLGGACAALLVAAAAGCASGEATVVWPVGDGGRPHDGAVGDGGVRDVPQQQDVPQWWIDAPTAGDGPPPQDDAGLPCESLGPVEGSGATCGTGDLGALADNGQTITITGNIFPAGTEDWYTFSGRDSNSGGCDKLHVTVQLLNNPGNQFLLDVYRGACPATGTPDGGCAGATRYDWYTDFTAVTGGNAVGECPCAEGAAASGVKCADDTGTYYVRVRRADSWATGCDSYTLEVSNGKYHGPAP
jgi:hypothetical protein